MAFVVLFSPHTGGWNGQSHTELFLPEKIDKKTGKFTTNQEPS